MLRNRILSCLTLLSLVWLLVACDQQTETPGTSTSSTPTASNPPTASTPPTATAAPTASTDNSQGQKIYENSCQSCHDSGMVGAPKLGDQAAWKDLITEGIDDLVQTTTNGKGNMPPKGGDQSLNEDDIRAAVTYMVDQVR